VSSSGSRSNIRILVEVFACFAAALASSMWLVTQIRASYDVYVVVGGNVAIGAITMGLLSISHRCATSERSALLWIPWSATAYTAICYASWLYPGSAKGFDSVLSFPTVFSVWSGIALCYLFGSLPVTLTLFLLRSRVGISNGSFRRKGVVVRNIGEVAAALLIGTLVYVVCVPGSAKNGGSFGIAMIRECECAEGIVWITPARRTLDCEADNEIERAYRRVFDHMEHRQLSGIRDSGRCPLIPGARSFRFVIRASGAHTMQDAESVP
jgi:hypothetical protein